MSERHQNSRVCGMSRGNGIFMLAGFAMIASGCQEILDRGQRDDEIVRKVQVSENEMRAARLLSITNNGALDTTADPYERAVACVVSVEKLGARLRAANVLTDAQLEAVTLAQQNFRRRAVELAEGNAAAVERDVEAGLVSEADPNEQARVGIACLRQMA